MSFTANLAEVPSENDIFTFVRLVARHRVSRIEKGFGWVIELLLNDRFTLEGHHSHGEFTTDCC